MGRQIIIWVHEDRCPAIILSTIITVFLSIKLFVFSVFDFFLYSKFAAVLVQTRYDWLYFYGNVSIIEKQIAEVSANIFHKCIMYQTVKKNKKCVQKPRLLDEVSFICLPIKMFISLRGRELFLATRQRCTVDLNAAQMWVQNTCWLIFRIICNHMTQSGDFLPSSKFWHIHYNLWPFSHASI